MRHQPRQPPHRYPSAEIPCFWLTISQAAANQTLSGVRVPWKIVPAVADPVPGPPPIDVAAIRAYCDGRVPAQFLDQLRVEAVVDGNAVTIVERRPPWREDFGPEWTAGLVARLRYTHKTATWSLFWRDRYQKWHRYTRLGPSARVNVLLDEIEADPTAIFWG